MSNADKFIQMCTTLPQPEVKDERGEDSVPELVKVAELRDAGNMQNAIDYGMTLMRMYPDNDLIPFMIAYIYYQKEFPGDARKVAIEAIPRCPRKYRLYSVAGLAEFDMGHLPEALVWWSRSVIAQCTVTDFQESDSFLHLATAAEVLGQKKEAGVLLLMADTIDPSKLRLDEGAVSLMRQLSHSWVKKPFADVLKHINLKYLQG